MSIHYCKGDLFLSGCQTLAHGCNCVGLMGAGIAKEFKKRFPEMYNEYKIRCMSNTFVPGDYFLWKKSTPWILNLATQYSTNGANIDLINYSFQTIADYYKNEGITSIAMPLIGAGLGGLTWGNVNPILIKHLGSIDIPVFVYSEYQKGLKAEEKI